MPVRFSFGDDMSLSEQPDQEGASRKFFRRPVVRVCDHCARVQDGLAVAAVEEQWTDQATYLTARGVSHGDVW